MVRHYLVVCSCGATTILRERNDGIWQADSRSWEFTVSDESCLTVNQGWNCGTRGHFQRTAYPVDANNERHKGDE
jgi:hypothetical protein